AEDRTFDQYLPAFATNEPRVLVDKAIRANTRERIGWRIKIEARHSLDQRNATQALERYAYAWHWMSDRERREAARLFPLQYTLAWFGSVRGGAILIPMLRDSTRSKYADKDGYTAPFLTRTPDPLYSVWSDDGCFFASQDFRDPKRYSHLPGIGGAVVVKQNHCETWNVWWKDAEGDVWNATILGDRCFAVPPTNHTPRRGLKYLPVYIDAPLYGAPAEATIGDSDQTSLAARHEGVLHSVKDIFAVANFVNSCYMVLLKDSTFSILLNTTGTPITEDQIKDLYRRRSILNLRTEEGRGTVQPLPPPQLSASVETFQDRLTRMMQLGGMPDTAIAGVSEGMTGVAIQEMAMQGDYKAGPISDMLRRLFGDGIACVWGQQRALGRKVRLSGRDRRDLVLMDVNPADLPREGDYILEALHQPTLVRDRFREAQTMMTERNGGRSFEASADEYYDDPEREVSLKDQEDAKALPFVKFLDLAREMAILHPERTDLVRAFMTAAVNSMPQPAAPTGGVSPAPQPGTDMAAEPMPQLPGGLAAPPDVNPADAGDSSMLGQIGGAVPQNGGY
ncbi:MAG: hypothetical protein ACRDJ9_25165, partial [Dehalococcoidia bacterium]